MTARPIKVADLFCGAGGSSTGAQRALARLGLSMDLLCVNHWPVAIETHQLNHPEARHYCQDVATVRPREAVSGGRLDLLMASPTCTYHSRARGGKPTSDQQRMDPWHVVTWLTELRVKRLIVENVPEFVEWGPIDERSGRPIKSRKGEYFRAWLSAIEAVGMRWDWRILNAADYGDATTRERFFLIARSDGKRICWPEPTHAPDTLALGKLPWRPAREIIDWSIAGRSIFNRKRRLSPRTLARAVVVAVYTGQRLGDLIRMTWADFDGEGIHVTQRKTGARLWVACHRDLREALLEWRSEDRPATTILVSQTGRPWAPGSLSTAFSAEVRRHSELSGCRFHGLRKTAAPNLAEAGCTTGEIGAITGHRSLQMLAYYTRSASQETMARAAILKLENFREKKETKAALKD